MPRSLNSIGSSANAFAENLPSLLPRYIARDLLVRGEPDSLV
jgi:hypothetical protein